MRYFLNLFSPDTAEAFIHNGGLISGFRTRQRNAAERVQPGDLFVCYVTKISRWIGVLRILEGPFEDTSPIFYEANDPFVVRFKVAKVVWMALESAIPIHQDFVWNGLSFTRDHTKSSSSWTGKLRASLNEIPQEDGEFLVDLLKKQSNAKETYPLTSDDRRKMKTHRVRTQTAEEVEVVVPDEDNDDEETEESSSTVRESIRVQARLASIGDAMGYRVWIPRSDQGRVAQNLGSGANVPFLDALPLNYDETTLQTIEQIDVIWLKGRSIVRVFEVEHTTSIYSGILRMADLMALQPNLDIRAHIVAPLDRREKVLRELRRPVFSLLEKGPLANYCSYIGYEEIETLANEKFIGHMTDSVLEEIAEYSE